MRKSWTFRTSRHFWERDDLSLGAKGIAHILLCSVDEKGEAWPTTPQIAKWAGVSGETVDKYLAELRDSGVISWRIWMDDHGHKRRRFNLDPKGEKTGVGQGGKKPPLTSTKKQGERLWVKPPPKWDGLGGAEYDGRRNLMQSPD